MNMHASQSEVSVQAPVGGNEPEVDRDAYRRSHPQEVLGYLRELCEKKTMISLSAPNGANLRASLTRVDQEGKRIALEVGNHDPQADALVDSNEVTAVAYLDAIKLQFDLQGLILLHRGSDTVLQSPIPSYLYRFQRRSAFRVDSPDRNGLTMHMRHPSMPDMKLALRVVDLSTGGCAAVLPKNVPPFAVGMTFNHVMLDLDESQRLTLNLRIQHVSSSDAESGDTRLGCEFSGVDPLTERHLQRYIDQVQKRRRQLLA